MTAVELVSDEATYGQMFVYISIVLTVVILCLIAWLQQNSHTWKLGIKIPGPVPLPFFGNALMVLGLKNSNAIFDRALELSILYGDICRGFLGHKLFVFLSHPDDIEIILNTHLDKSSDYDFFKPWLGDGLLISSGEKWRSHRKLIRPAFHQNVLKTFINVFYEHSLKTVDRMRKESGKEFDVHNYMSETTVDILLETAMGHPRTHNDDEGFKYAMAVMKLCDILHKRHGLFYYRFNVLFNFTKLKRKHDELISIVHSLTGKVFKNKKEEFTKNMANGIVLQPTFANVVNNTDDSDQHASESNSNLHDDLDDQDANDVGIKRRLAFLDLMIESAYHGPGLTDEEIREEVDTIMFEGHDTTAAGSSFVLCLLGIHHDIQNLVWEEQLKIFGKGNRQPSFNDTVEMKYLERVILETLRMYPPVPVIARRVTEDVQLASQDLVIPSGATVVIAPFKTHRRADLYPNPNKFDPDHFLTERCQNRHYYGFIPFAAGPRSCVGRKYAMLKLKILLSTIIRNYKIVSDVEEKDFQLQGDIILKRADGFRIKLEKRWP